MISKKPLAFYLTKTQLNSIKENFNLQVLDVIPPGPNQEDPKLFIAKDLKTNQEVIVKNIRNIQNGFREVVTMKRFLGVDHIVQIINTVSDADYELIIMQKGECDLHQYITKCKIISDENLIQITSNILQGLTSMHKQGEGYWHRDLKPENIFVSFKNKNDLSKSQKQKSLYFGKQKVHAKIGDLGSAKQYIRGIELTKGIGTQPFKCPEIQYQQTTYNNKIDVWSLGLTLFELYTKTSYAEYYKKNPLLCMKQIGCRTIRAYLISVIDQKCQNKFKNFMKEIIKSCIQLNPVERQTIKNILQYFQKSVEKLNINQHVNINKEQKFKLENQINQYQNLKSKFTMADQMIQQYTNLIQNQKTNFAKADSTKEIKIYQEEFYEMNRSKTISSHKKEIQQKIISNNRYQKIFNKMDSKVSLYQQKKIYMLVKLTENISLSKDNNYQKIKLCSNQVTKITVKLINTMLKYNLIQFTLRKASQNQTYYLKFIDQNQKQYQSDKFLAKDYDQQINFFLEEFNYTQIKSEKSISLFSLLFKQSFRIMKSSLIQKFLMYCILGKEKIFKELFDWLEEKPNIRSIILQEINKFKQHQQDYDFIQSIKKQKKSKQNITPYVLANIYALRKQSFNVLNKGYIQKYFLQQIEYNKIQSIPLFKKYENTLRRCILQIYYIYSKQSYKVSDIFNDLLQSSPKDNLYFLMNIIYESKTSNRRSKLTNIDLNKLKNTILGLKDYIPIIEYIYFYLLFLEYINNERTLTLNYIIELITSLDFQHQEHSVIENVKNEQYASVCKQLLNFFYKEKNFCFNQRDDDFIRFYISYVNLPKRYKNIFITQALIDKTTTFIKARMQIKSIDTLQLLRLIFIQCQTLQLLYQHQFQGYIIEFFYKKKQSYNKYYKRQYTNILFKLDSNILEYFIQEIIVQFYIKKKYSNNDKFRVLNELIKELNLFSFEEIFTILDKGILRLNVVNKQHTFLINHLFTNILKNLIAKQPNFYQNLIQKKKWLFIIKLNSYSKQYLIYNLITQAKFLDKYNHKQNNSMIDMITDTILNTHYLTELQKDRIINLIYNINDQSSIDLPILKIILYERPHLALTYSKCLDRGNISITNKIKEIILQLKKQLKNKKIIYKNLKRIYEYKQPIWQKLSKLFDCVRDKTLKVIIQQLYTQCQNFITHLQMISKISKGFDFKICIQIKQTAINHYESFINMEKILDFEVNQILQPFRKLKPEVNEYICIKYFRNIIPDKQPNNSTQLVSMLNQCVNLFVQTVNRICSKYMKQQLRLNELQEITNNQNKKDIKEILKTNIDMSDQHINELIYVTEKVTQFNEFLILYETLENILNYYEQQRFNLIQLKDIFNNVKQHKYNQIEVYKTYHKIHDFQKILNGYQLKLNNKQDQINKVIKLTKLTKPLEGIWNMLDRISVQHMQEIKRHLISMHHQSTFCSYQLMLTMFQYVYNYYHTVIKNSKSVGQYLQKLTAFISANNVPQKVSLSSSILSLTNYFNIFEKYLWPNPQQKELQLLQNQSYLKNKQNQYLCQISNMKQQINQYKHTGYSQSKIIQQQQQKIKTLKQQNITLKKRVEVLEKQNKQLMVNNTVEQQKHMTQSKQKSSEIENLHILLKQKDRIISQYKSEVENHIRQNKIQKSKLIQANSIIQKYKKQIEALQNQIYAIQKDYQICKVKLEESTKRIKDREGQIQKYYEINNNLQNKKTADILKHKKEIEVLRTIINNITRYEKLSFLKQGGQAYIYICEDKEEKQIQKKKKILRVCSLEEQFKCLDIEKTLKQPEILSGLNHPNIIKIEKYWEYESYFKQLKPIRSISMILSYIDGGDLSGYIGKLNKFQIKKIYKDIKSALTYLHSNNIVHRDITSRNILVKNVDKSSIIAILTDLGISTILQQYNHGLHVTEKFTASTYYTPPQFGYDGIVTIKNDLWSLGVVMLEMTLDKNINKLRPSKTKKYLANYEDFPMKQLEMLKAHKDNSVFVEVISMLMRRNPSERTMIQL